MRRRAVAAILVGLTAPVGAAPRKDPYAGQRDVIARIIGGSFDGAALAQLTDLGDVVGARVTGTPAFEQAARWAKGELERAGATNVHLEKVTVPHGWRRGTARARMLGAGGRPLTVASYGWSPSTAGVVRGPVVVVTDWSALPANLKGSIVILAIAPATPVDDLTRPWLEEVATHRGLAALAAAGARAALFQGRRPAEVLGTGSPPGGELAPLPIAALAHEDALAIRRALDEHPVSIELDLVNKVSGPIEVTNVVGELPGAQRPDEWVLVGAHLDSWDFATGAQDNGAGVVQVLQTARLLASAKPLARTVRFALWTGEEQGLLGSRAYTLAHEAELGGCVAYLNTDNGAGHVQGWKVEGRADVQAALRPVAEMLAPLGGGAVSLDMTADTDHWPFVIAGVPALDLSVDMSNYMMIHHTVADTVDKVDAHALGTGTAVVAVTAYALATSAERLAPRLDRAGVDALLAPGGWSALLAEWGWQR